MATEPTSQQRYEGPERRSSLRAPTSLPIRLWLDVGWHQGLCENVSTGGLGVSVFRAFLLGEQVQVTLELGWGSPMHLDAEVAHTGVYPQQRMGLRFLELPLETRTRLEDWLAHRCNVHQESIDT